MNAALPRTSFQVWRPAHLPNSHDQLVTTGAACNFRYVTYDVSLQPADDANQ